MSNTALLSKTQEYVKKKMTGESTGHDWFHIERVVRMALKIAQSEKKANIFLVEMAALLHDIGDWKLNDSKKLEEEILTETMTALTFPKELQIKILDIVTNMSFSKNVSEKRELSLEGQIVQDADRLDALGAIGIARAFAYGGKQNREIYNPDIKPRTFQNTEAYRNSKSHTINHFYEKLFLLKDLMNTKYAKKTAEKREEYMQAFLDEFLSEWNN
jgi:uncharacterized protein